MILFLYFFAFYILTTFIMILTILRYQCTRLHSFAFYNNYRKLSMTATKLLFSSVKQNVGIQQKRSRLYELSQQNLSQSFQNHQPNFVNLDEALEQLKTRYGEKSLIYTKKLFKVSEKCAQSKIDGKAELYLKKVYELIKKYPKLERHFSVKYLQMELGSLCFSIGKHQEAIKFYSEYLSKYQQIQSSQQALNKFICLTQLTKIHMQLNNHQQTAKYLQATSQIIVAATKAHRYQFDNLLIMDHQFSKALDFVVFNFQQGQTEKAEKSLQTFIELLNSLSFVYQKNLQEAQERLQKIGVKNQFLESKLGTIRDQKKQKS